MSTWMDVLRRVEALEDLELDASLVSELQSKWLNNSQSRANFPLRFYTPTFKSFQSAEFHSCGSNAWLAISITGARCKLQCDHCKAKILEPMISAESPEELWRIVNEKVGQGGKGILLTGGSNHKNEVEYGRFYSTIRRIKDEFPFFQIAMHTALVDEDVAKSMEQSGVDVAMMDVIGAQETIQQVYHLKRDVKDFEETLAHLVNTNMKVVPHVVIGLHYGRMLGEWDALKIIRKHLPDAVVLIVVMPQYSNSKRPFATPNSTEIGRFFMDAREALADIPLMLGCARPAGLAKMEIDSYAVMAGLDGLAHPSEGVVELAARLERKIFASSSCCSVSVGDGVFGNDSDNLVSLNLEDVLVHERSVNNGLFKKIKIISA